MRRTTPAIRSQSGTRRALPRGTRSPGRRAPASPPGPAAEVHEPHRAPGRGATRGRSPLGRQTTGPVPPATGASSGNTRFSTVTASRVASLLPRAWEMRSRTGSIATRESDSDRSGRRSPRMDGAIPAGHRSVSARSGDRTPSRIVRPSGASGSSDARASEREDREGADPSAPSAAARRGRAGGRRPARKGARGGHGPLAPPLTVRVRRERFGHGAAGSERRS